MAEQICEHGVLSRILNAQPSAFGRGLRRAPADVAGHTSEWIESGTREAPSGAYCYASRYGDRRNRGRGIRRELRDRWPLMRRERNAGQSLAGQIEWIGRGDGRDVRARRRHHNQHMAVRAVVYVGAVDRPLRGWLVLVAARHARIIEQCDTGSTRPDPRDRRAPRPIRVPIVRIGHQTLDRRRERAEHDDERRKRAAEPAPRKPWTGHEGSIYNRTVTGMRRDKKDALRLLTVAAPAR